MSEDKNKVQESDIENYVKKTESEKPVTSLGKVDVNKDRPIVGEVGYIDVPIKDLPSQGLFYPDNTTIAIRAASVAEIRHWSTIDETNYSNMDDILNFIIEKCVRIKFPDRPSSWKDIKDIDRFYLIFAVREFTFKNGENKLYVPGENNERIEVTKDMISYFNLNEKIKRFYSHDEKCLIIPEGGKLNLPKPIKFYIPSIGVAQFLKKYVQGKQRKEEDFDESFIKYANFIFNDWRALTLERYENEVRESLTWSIEKISIYDKFSDLLADGVDPKIVYEKGGTEQEAPLNFQGGIKSLFIISDILDELV